LKNNPDNPNFFSMPPTEQEKIARGIKERARQAAYRMKHRAKINERLRLRRMRKDVQAKDREYRRGRRAILKSAYLEEIRIATLAAGGILGNFYIDRVRREKAKARKKARQSTPEYKAERVVIAMRYYWKKKASLPIKPKKSEAQRAKSAAQRIAKFYQNPENAKKRRIRMRYYMRRRREESKTSQLILTKYAISQNLHGK
jgi:hypothetical protein